MRRIEKKIITYLDKIDRTTEVKGKDILVIFKNGYNDKEEFRVNLNELEMNDDNITLIVLTNKINFNGLACVSEAEFELYKNTEWEVLTEYIDNPNTGKSQESP